MVKSVMHEFGGGGDWMHAEIPQRNTKHSKIIFFKAEALAQGTLVEDAPKSEIMTDSLLMILETCLHVFVIMTVGQMF